MALVVAALTLSAPQVASAQFRYPPAYPPYGAGYARTESDLRINVKPNDAAVYVDGYYAGIVDDFDGTFQRLHIEPGQHEIVVYLAGYRSLRERLYLSPNASKKISATLERLASGDPEEAPPEPIDRPGTTPGRPTPGNGPLPRRGSPPPNRPEPNLPSARVGTLSIRVQPGDADVFIDGERWTVGSTSDRLVVELTEGRHVIEVEKTGYRRFSTEVQVRSGQTAPLNVSLTRDR